MAPPSLKKQKVDNSMSPIVFTSFGTFGVASVGQPSKYDWVTKIDGKNKWHIIHRSPKNEPYELHSFERRHLTRNNRIRKAPMCNLQTPIQHRQRRRVL
ncbi:hypothetical protein IFR05_016004 [Cadophora sp. M221]|nr:hypothetical protein IFR05_016004 [Cadophora sp. M221]